MQACLLMAEREMTRRRQVIGGLRREPRLQHVADAEALILTSEEAPRALQLSPELHEAFLGVLNLNHNIKFQIENDN